MFLCVCLSVCPLAGQMMCLSFLYGGLSLGPGFADMIGKKMEGRKTQGEVFRGG